MNILQVYQIFNPDIASGAARVAFDISSELVKRGHRVVVCTSDMRNKFTRGICKMEALNGVIVHRFKTISPLLVRKLKIYITPAMISIPSAYLRKFDVVHIHGYRSFQSAIFHFHCKHEKIPYIMQAHGTLPTSTAYKELKSIYDYLVGYKILKSASKGIALTQLEAERYKSMGVPEEKIAIIPNGIDLSEYAELPPKGAFKKKFNIPEDRKIILYLGRIHKTKGIDFLVRAYAHLINEMNFKDAVLVIAGPDDGYLSEIKSLVQGLSASNSILFTGPLYGEDKLAAYVDSQVYVLPSRYETFPMTVLEAYACEKPVIASKVGGLGDMVVNGVTGLLIKPGDIEQLTYALLCLLNDDKRAREMGSRGRKLIQKKFSIE
ncbi:MAG: glycosyltransferase, partial [Candidatus Njordarchaeales archaeon]